jgi:hypothetical protein
LFTDPWNGKKKAAISLGVHIAANDQEKASAPHI